MTIEQLEKEFVGQDKNSPVYFRIGAVSYPITKVEFKQVANVVIAELKN